MENCDLIGSNGSFGTAAKPRARIGLSRHDARALTAFVRGSPADLSEMLEDARALAENLVLDGDATRARIEARMVASARTHQRVLETMLGDCLAKRDFDAVLIISRVLDGTVKRLNSSLRLMATESALRRRPSVTIRHADAVHFSDEAS